VIIELNLMNLKTCYDVLCSNFYASWACRIDDARDYAFSYLCGFLIRAQQKLLNEGKLEN
jgi:hypothetical protein